MKNPIDRGGWRVTVHRVAKRAGHNLVTKKTVTETYRHTSFVANFLRNSAGIIINS